MLLWKHKHKKFIPLPLQRALYFSEANEFHLLYNVPVSGPYSTKLLNKKKLTKMEKIGTVTRNPMVKGWTFLRKSGNDADGAKADLSHAIRELGTFMADGSANRLELRPYEVILNGAVYDHSKFANGDRITTSVIDHIDKIPSAPCRREFFIPQTPLLFTQNPILYIGRVGAGRY